MSRIIPARAGFTSGVGLNSTFAADHPRSRGVYHVPGNQGSRHAGSSPLARGLRRRCWCSPFLSRIIPARAGFTPRLLWA